MKNVTNVTIVQDVEGNKLGRMVLKQLVVILRVRETLVRGKKNLDAAENFVIIDKLGHRDIRVSIHSKDIEDVRIVGTKRMIMSKFL